MLPPAISSTPEREKEYVADVNEAGSIFVGGKNRSCLRPRQPLMNPRWPRVTQASEAVGIKHTSSTTKHPRHSFLVFMKKVGRNDEIVLHEKLKRIRHGQDVIPGIGFNLV